MLRYWADLSVDQAADVLGCSPGTVKTLGARALGRLRGVLGDALTDPGPPGDRHQAEETWHG
jgi:DNA-directed RNA polymerase specialized sigma24 family protein